MKNILELKHISKNFGTEKILSEVSLSLEKGKTLSLLGSSGSGKTTLLKIIAGLEKQDSGSIFLNETEISQTKPQNRQCIYLYQEPLLFPHLNVFENIAFGLRIRKEKEELIQQKVNEIVELIDLTSHVNKMTHQLSGGQRQRISFARAIIIKPKVLLLDEPFGALDTTTREQMQKLFKKLSQTMQISSLFVTHDIKESIIMGDSISKIEKGKLIQYEDKKDFFQDSASGVQNEINFWKQFNF
ncbi:sulfate ABC transporter ATP-binding protein [Flavobacterium sp. 316]|uniref:ATP-binding cassette domain-containing protein n=1 Tax=Flavobacterium sediminilitoris TaxID=2024526 RepID=A0ABY4HN38_9FLAO|nr:MULTISPECIES: ATP-binding cassette domain-containing protein [Flavobacterium]KIX21532.1 sulfate ABC transporter ATP-binding protein [Flavobacterium sp. 316]UOX34274.1 ATP-binding cassette domain-containing protein [Flavobacterium sediminilitoris]